MKVQDLEWTSFALVAIFYILSMILSAALRLELKVSLSLLTLRTIAQLFLLGYILSWIFRLNQPILIFLVFLFMVFFAGYTIWQRISNKSLIPSVEYFYLALASMLVVGLAIPYFVNAWIIGLDQWYQPRYLLPIVGMVLGNSMNGVTLSINAFQERLSGQKEAIVARMALGATEKEATQQELRYAVHQGMTPQLNAMAAVGLVFIPGMMTGQILAGAEPILASMYQIIVMLMLLGASSLGTMLIVLALRWRLFRRDLFPFGADH